MREDQGINVPEVLIICPACGKKGNITISNEELNKTGRGLLAVNIPKKTICNHSFTTYIDRNAEVRDYFMVDFEVSLPDLSSMDKDPAEDISKDKIMDIDLIRLNLPAATLTYILRSIFSKQKIVLITNQEFLREHFHNFFEFITEQSFKTDISVISEDEYMQNKKDYKKTMVFKRTEIINNYKDLIDKKTLRIEKMIVNKFLSEGDLGYGYIILKNEIFKAYKFSKKFVEIIENWKHQGKELNTLKIAYEIEKEFNVDINNQYLRFLMGIIESYFGKEVPPITDSFLGMF
jgi:hypothetical protein